MVGAQVACGMISQYNKQGDALYGVKSLANVVFKRLKFEGRFAVLLVVLSQCCDLASECASSQATA